MRKIEQQMLDAVKANRTWNGGNTTVASYSDGMGGFYPCIHLHGNHIASFIMGRCVVNLETLQKWPTPTTKSRLRALGANVQTRKGITYINGVPV